MSAILYSTVRLSSPRLSCVSPPTSCPAAVLLHLGTIFSASFIPAALLDDVFFRNTVITAKFALATHTRTPPKRAERPYRPFAHSIRIWRGVVRGVGVLQKEKMNYGRLVSLAAKLWALGLYSLVLRDTWCVFGFGGDRGRMASEGLLNLRALSAYHPWLSSVPN